MLECVARAFHAIGSGSATQEVIFWNLSVTKNVGRNEIMDKPDLFFEGLRDIYGEAGTVVFEFMLAREIKREFGLKGASDSDTLNESTSNLLSLIAHVKKGS
jgi:hypothetical protein